jgi:chitinase
LGYSLELDTVEQRDEFYTSCRDIIEKYGFDGLDIDIEQSILNNIGETSVLNPVKPMNVNLIWICRSLHEYFGDGFMLTMAPEHPYVQGGAYWWSGWQGIWGGYLPLINGTRDIITFIHPQLYNNNFVDYPDPYNEYSIDTFVFVTQLLIEGFTVATIGEHFDGLRPDQVVLGVLTESAAYSGNGELPAEDYAQAVKLLIDKYPDFRGAMTWSIGGDSRSGGSFLERMRELFDSYGTQTVPAIKETREFLLGVTAHEQIPDIDSSGTVNVFDLIGQL